ncbi:MAG TPA: hypothetical protein DET40_18455 [Lentisphaeria bacterium]|nr:MAG: hypothetical protein A2X45_14595 [Lentisphaerae bacterium GWF2_50_93]HCE45526.1 hypothetical protein [Lentisphaeria bacterium]
MRHETENVRPKTLEDFIGQRNLAREIRIALTSATLRRDAFPHAILSGAPGLGKTSLAEVIANEMKVPFFPVLGASVRDEGTLKNLLAKLPSDGYNMATGEIEDLDKIRPAIIFIDEIHRMKKPVTELLHTALEDFKISMKMKNPLTGRSNTGLYWIPKFTLIGATNYLGDLPKPFVDRFMIQASFETYTEEEMVLIARNSSKAIGLNITEEAIADIAAKSRGVPRILNRFLLRARDVAIYSGNQGIDSKCVMEMFDIQQIDELGLTKLDRRVLEYLGEVIRPLGLSSVAQAVGEDDGTIENIVEPWLLKLRLMVRTSQGRQITELGLKHMGHSLEENSGIRLIA